MTTELCIAIGIVLGLVVGLMIGRTARRERDGRISALEKEIDILRNVCESNNETTSRLRRENKRLQSK